MGRRIRHRPAGPKKFIVIENGGHRGGIGRGLRARWLQGFIELRPPRIAEPKPRASPCRRRSATAGVCLRELAAVSRQ